MKVNELRHVLLAKHITREWFEQFIPKAQEIKRKLRLARSGQPAEKTALRKRLAGKTMFAFFAEESTRTRFSFCKAGVDLGMDVIWCENGRFSSMAKGETLEETVEVLLGYDPDILVLRHADDDASERAARISDRSHGGIPIINAGSGKKHHPTQALLDLYTIWELVGRVDNLTVVIGPDVFFSRTARSLAYLLSKFSGITIRFITPVDLLPPDELVEHLREAGVTVIHTTDVLQGVSGANAVYWGRLQTERVDDLEKRKSLEEQCTAFQITQEVVSRMDQSAILMHPMPISKANEVTLEVRQGNFPQFKVYEQARNGPPVRMALLLELLGEPKA